MNAENFSQYIENPSLLYQMNYEELKQLILQYPFNANLRYLLVKKSQQEEHRDFERNLKAAAINSPDRKHLYNMLHEEGILAAEELEERLELKSLQELDLQTASVNFYQSDDSEQELTFDLGEDHIAEINDAFTTTNPTSEDSNWEEEVEEEIVRSTDSISNSLLIEEYDESPEDIVMDLSEEHTIVEDQKTDIEEPPTVALPSETSEHEEATDKIILPEDTVMISGAEDDLENTDPMEELFSLNEDNANDDDSDHAITEPETLPKERPVFQPSHRSQFKSWRTRYQKPHHSNIFETPRYDTASLQVANQSIEHSDELVTETLANLLTNQHKFDKAIEVYERLSLLFPEKSDFFAARIENIRKQMK